MDYLPSSFQQPQKGKSLSRVRLFANPWTVTHLCPWDSPGKGTGLGCHALLQGIFLTQGSNLALPHGRQFFCVVFFLPSWVTRELTTSEGMVNSYLECPMRKHGLMCWITCWRARALVNWWAWTKKMQVCPSEDVPAPSVWPSQESLPELCAPTPGALTMHREGHPDHRCPQGTVTGRGVQKRKPCTWSCCAWHRARLMQGRGEGTDQQASLEHWPVTGEWEEQIRTGHWSWWHFWGHGWA